MKNVMTVQGPIHLYILLINFTTMSFPYPKTPPTIKESGALDWAFPQSVQFSSVQSLSGDRLFATPGRVPRQASLSITKYQGLPKFRSIELMMSFNDPILCLALLLLPLIFPSIRVFSNESALRIRWPKDWASAAASVLPVNIQGWFPPGLTGLISLQSKVLSRFFSTTMFHKHQFFSAQLTL